VAGLALLLKPAAGIVSLTAVLTAFFIVEGVFQTVAARQGRESMLLPTMLVGSYAQPEWLIDRAKLAGRFPPRVRAKELWRIPEPYLAQAQDDATVLAIKAQEDLVRRHRIGLVLPE
jgi:hypothetical protein